MLSTPIYMVAGASFFIYLLQFKFWAVATHLHIPALLAWPVAVAGGVAVWAGWNWISQRAGRWLDAVKAPRRGWRVAGQEVAAQRLASPTSRRRSARVKGRVIIMRGWPASWAGPSGPGADR